MSTATTSKSERLGPVVSRANATIFITTAVLGVLIWFTVSAGMWLTLFALDNLFKLPAALRFPLSVVAAILTVWLFWRYVIISVRNRMSNEHVALMLEKKYGIDENALINTIQFEEMKYGDHQKDFVLEIAKAGSSGLKRVPLRELWQFGRMGLWGGVFALFFSLFAVYVLTMPRYAENAFFRYAHGLSDVPPVGSVSLDVIPDHDVTVAEHEDLEVTLTVGRLAAGGELTTYPQLFYKEGVGAVGNHRGDGTEMKMEPVVGKPHVYRYTFEDVRRSFAFRIFVRDTYTRSVQVTVNPGPKIAESCFYITPPAYVAEETREEAGPPHPVKCLPRSKLGIEIKMDKPVEWLRWLPAWLPQDENLDFEETEELTWKTNVEIGNSAGAYDVEAKARRLEKPMRIATGTIMLKTDRKPQVRFVDTAMSRIVTPGDHLPLRIEAEDDYGIGDLKVTARPAYGGSRPKTVREWKFGDAPGQREKAEKRFELDIDASIFVPGRKFFLEGRCSDFCPDTPAGVSEPILLTVKSLGRLTSSEDSGFGKLYEALERAIHLQKKALDGTRNLSTNINHVWMNMSHERRSDDEIQAILDENRKNILGNQLGVREALLEGVKVAPDKAARLPTRMEEIAKAEAVEANDRAFVSCRRPFRAGERDPVVKDAFPPGQDIQAVHFDGQGRRARFFGLVVFSPHGWSDETRISRLSLLGEDGNPLDTSGWKVLSARGSGKGTEKAFDKQGWLAKGRLPHFLLVDMHSERRVTGIECAGHGSRGPKDFALYLWDKNPPRIVPDSPDKESILDELELLQGVQEAIYNQLLALKGMEAEKIAKKKEEKAKKALGEEGWEQPPTVAEKLEDFRDQLNEWLRKHEKNVKERKAVMGVPQEDLSKEDKQKLDKLNLEKRKQARKFGDMVDDLARTPWDFADEQQAKVSEVVREAQELDDLVAVAAEKAEQGMFSWNMDNMISKEAKEIEHMAVDMSGGPTEPGQAEAAEDKARPLKIAELPTELPVRVTELQESLEDLDEPPMSGSMMFDHQSPTGGQISDNMDSASADGLMSNRTPNPRNKTKGRGSIGRSGQADGQMVANEAPSIPDDETAMPPRMSPSPSEPSTVSDEGTQPAVAIGLGKGTAKPIDFARGGRLPPDQLRKMREFWGEATEILENSHPLLLALDRYNLPTTDLKKALNRLKQIQLATKGGQGLEVRQALDEAIKHMNAAENAIARSMELRRRKQAEYSKKRQYAAGGGADTVPEGYNDIVTTYFKRLAEDSANPEQ